MRDSDRGDMALRERGSAIEPCAINAGLIDQKEKGMDQAKAGGAREGASKRKRV